MLPHYGKKLPDKLHAFNGFVFAAALITFFVGLSMLSWTRFRAL